MRSWVGVGLATIGVTGALAVPHDASAAGKTAKFKVTAVQSSPQGQMTMTSQVWVTAKEARADMHHPLGGDMTVLINKSGIYQLDPKAKQGVKGKLPDAMAKSADNFDFLISRLAFNGSQVADKATKIKTETFAGYACDVYKHSIAKQGRSRTITVWLPQKMSPRFAVKAIIDSSVSKPGLTAKEKLTVQLSQIKLNETIPASTFAVPSGYKIVEGKLPPAPGQGG